MRAGRERAGHGEGRRVRSDRFLQGRDAARRHQAWRDPDGRRRPGGPGVPKMVARDFPDRVEASFELVDATSPDRQAQAADPAGGSWRKPPTRLTMNGVVRTPRDPAAAGDVRGDRDAHQLQGESLRLHHPVVRAAGVRLEERAEARRHGAAARRRRRGAVRRPAGVRQRAAPLHSRQRLLRSAGAVGHAERHQRVVLADAAGGRGRHLRAVECLARRGVQPAVRRAGRRR